MNIFIWIIYFYIMDIVFTPSLSILDDITFRILLALELMSRNGSQAKVSYFKLLFTKLVGRALAQAVSRRLPTAAARLQTRVWSCGIL
jgi:hypothetical protein